MSRKLIKISETLLDNYYIVVLNLIPSDLCNILKYLLHYNVLHIYIHGIYFY